MADATRALEVLRKINEYRLALLMPDLPEEAEEELREGLAKWERRLRVLDGFRD